MSGILTKQVTNAWGLTDSSNSYLLQGHIKEKIKKTKDRAMLL
jgi:hypothetical protein